MSKQRDYDLEMRDTADHRYAYGFDFDVMHPYMIRSHTAVTSTPSA